MKGTNPCRPLWLRIKTQTAVKKRGEPAGRAGNPKPANRQPPRRITFLEMP
jgi:hypothetical protein